MAIDVATRDRIRVGSLDDLKAHGRMVVRGRHCPLLVVYEQGQVHALDNRCPHLGFPLHKGSIQDGILTCHWHHARFDLKSGGTFDLWADDVPTTRAWVEDGEVWVAPECRLADPAGHWRRRLGDGMAHNLGLVIAKSVLGARAAGVPDAALVRDAALFGARHRDGFGVGMTIMTALANLLPILPEEEAYLALFQGIRRVAADCDGMAPRRDRAALAGAGAERRHARALASPVDRGAASQRRRAHAAHRHRPGPAAGPAGGDAAGRGHRPAVCRRRPCAGLRQQGLRVRRADRPRACGGHPAYRGRPAGGGARRRRGQRLAPSDRPRAADGAERSTTCRRRSPPDANARGGFTGHARLAEALLVDDPAAIAASLLAALEQGAVPHDLGRALAYAAALRIARFGTANEFSDWDTALHGFTYANALHQLLGRVGEQEEAWPLALRGVLHGAMALWLSRYLNQPPARLPDVRRDRLDELPDDPEALCENLLDAFDRQQQVNPAARLVARYLQLRLPTARLLGTLAHALLREDADFHTYQMFEAAVRQHHEWGDSAEGHAILIALARYLAAHCPTERARFQTATIARRLHRGGRIYEDETEA